MRIPFSIPLDEVEITAIRASGPGGQNVNKVSTAVQLRFDISGSSLPEALRIALLALPDRRISREGVLVIKADKFRSQEKNRAEALRRLELLVASVATPRKPRRPTRPSRRAIQKRLDDKAHRAAVKATRRDPG